MENKKSWGVKVLGIGIICFGLLSVFVTTVGAYFLMSVKKISFSTFLSEMKFFDKECLALFFPREVVYLIALFYFVVMLLSGIGIIRFKQWGRKILISLAGVGIIWDAGDFVFAKRPIDVSDAIITLIELFILIYLTRPKIKEQFE